MKLEIMWTFEFLNFENVVAYITVERLSLQQFQAQN